MKLLITSCDLFKLQIGIKGGFKKRSLNNQKDEKDLKPANFPLQCLCLLGIGETRLSDYIRSVNVIFIADTCKMKLFKEIVNGCQPYNYLHKKHHCSA